MYRRPPDGRAQWLASHGSGASGGNPPSGGKTEQPNQPLVKVETSGHGDTYIVTLPKDPARREVYGRGIPCGAVYIAEGIGIVHNLDRGWAAEAGIVSGYGGGRFGPNDEITREQLAVMLFRYAQLLNMSTGGRDSLTGFSDTASVSPWAQDAVAWAVDSGIISGLPNPLN